MDPLYGVEPQVFTLNIVVVDVQLALHTALQLQHVRKNQHVHVDTKVVLPLDIVQQQVQHGIQTIPKQQLHVQEADVLKLGLQHL